MISPAIRPSTVFHRRAALAGFALLVALALPSALPSIASAQMSAPQLLSTNPQSPGASLTPRILGDVDGGITRRRLAPGGTDADDPSEITVRIYTNDACTGTPAATGNGLELEGIGIPVTVAADQTTTFWGTSTDTTTMETSRCSAPGLPYRQVSTPPPAPTFTSSNPASPADDNVPKLLGTAEPGSTVAIFTNSSCTGTSVTQGPASDFSSVGIQVGVEDDTTTTFYAVAILAGLRSPCSTSSLTYQEVTFGAAPPAPVVLGVSPQSPANDNRPRVSGSAASGATVELFTNSSCEGSPAGSGTAEEFAAGGIEVNVPDDSTTTFFATATRNGKVSGCSPASVTYREDSSAPRAPDLVTRQGRQGRELNVTVAGSAPGAQRVKLFSGEDCKGSPALNVSADELAAGIGVRVRENATTKWFAIAVDEAGNGSKCSDPTAYTHDSIAPKTRITMGPSVKTRKRKQIFRFTDATGGEGTSFVCKLDKRKWRPCSAPQRYKKLKYGRHTFRVKATDAAGNNEAKAVKRSFKIVRR